MTDPTAAHGRDGESRLIVAEVEAVSMENLQKEATVRMRGGTSFTIRCDEGVHTGGDNSAPTPLSIFAAGVAF